MHFVMGVQIYQNQLRFSRVIDKSLQPRFLCAAVYCSLGRVSNGSLTKSSALCLFTCHTDHSVLQFRPSLERIVDKVERSVLVHLSYGHFKITRASRGLSATAELLLLHSALLVILLLQSN